MPKTISVGKRVYKEYGRPRTLADARQKAYDINTYGIGGKLVYAVVREYKGKHIVYVRRTNQKNPITKRSFISGGRQ